MTYTGPVTRASFHHDVEYLLRRVQAEFLEMPGLLLTEAQVRRLWNLDAATCTTVLAELVRARFLVRTPHGAFMRFDRATSAAPARANISGTRTSAA